MIEERGNRSGSLRPLVTAMARDSEGGGRRDREERDSEFVDRLDAINRIAKVGVSALPLSSSATRRPRRLCTARPAKFPKQSPKQRKPPSAVSSACRALHATFTDVMAPAAWSCVLHRQAADHRGGPMRCSETLGARASSPGSSSLQHGARHVRCAEARRPPRTVAARRNLEVSALQSSRRPGRRCRCRRCLREELTYDQLFKKTITLSGQKRHQRPGEQRATLKSSAWTDRSPLIEDRSRNGRKVASSARRRR